MQRGGDNATDGHKDKRRLLTRLEFCSVRVGFFSVKRGEQRGRETPTQTPNAESALIPEVL